MSKLNTNQDSGDLCTPNYSSIREDDTILEENRSFPNLKLQNDVNIKTIHDHKISSVTNEMNLHPNNVNQCSSCEFKTFSKNDLQDHVANTHNTGLANETNKSAEANSTALAVNSVRNSTKTTKNKGKGKRAAHSCQGQLHLIYNKKLRVQMIIRL